MLPVESTWEERQGQKKSQRPCYGLEVVLATPFSRLPEIPKPNKDLVRFEIYAAMLVCVQNDGVAFVPDVQALVSLEIVDVHAFFFEHFRELALELPSHSGHRRPRNCAGVFVRCRARIRSGRER